MEEITVLRDLLLIFAIGVGVAFSLKKVGVPSLAGFIVAGILIGPNFLGLIPDVHDVELLAEIGVVLLLFGIGLELSLDKLKRLWKPVLIGGTLQVGLSIGATVWVATTFSLPVNQSIFLGCMVAISSTAIVLRGLEYRGEIDAPHGRFALGILVFQDLCVVPMMLAIPLLAGNNSGGSAPLISLGKAALVVGGVLIASRIAVPRFLHLIAHTRQRDLFVLAVLLVCIGTAWFVSLFGISLALGAFLAGLVVAGSDYRHQAMADLIPFREVLASMFFISVGMLFDPVAVIRDPLPVFGLLAAILVGKMTIILLVGLVMRIPFRVTLITGMILSQIGEFLFVLTRAAKGTGLLDETLTSQLMGAAILSMLVTPLLMYVSPKLAAGVTRFGMLQRYLGVDNEAEKQGSKQLRNHVIIAGHGITGQALTSSLALQGIPYAIVELNAETVRTLRKKKEPAFFGDVVSEEMLHRLGIHHAKELVIAISDPDAALRALSTARRLAPKLPILVRTRYVGEVEELLDAGATNVVPAEYESALEIVFQVLSRHGIPREQIDAYLETMHQKCRVKEG